MGGTKAAHSDRTGLCSYRYCDWPAREQHQITSILLTNTSFSDELFVLMENECYFIFEQFFLLCDINFVVMQCIGRSHDDIFFI